MFLLIDYGIFFRFRDEGTEKKENSSENDRNKYYLELVDKITKIILENKFYFSLLSGD